MRKSLDGCRRENNGLGKKEKRERKRKSKRTVSSRSADAENSAQCLPRSRGNKAKKEQSKESRKNKKNERERREETIARRRNFCKVLERHTVLFRTTCRNMHDCSLFLGNFITAYLTAPTIRHGRTPLIVQPFLVFLTQTT